MTEPDDIGPCKRCATAFTCPVSCLLTIARPGRPAHPYAHRGALSGQHVWRCGRIAAFDRSRTFISSQLSGDDFCLRLLMITWIHLAYPLQRCGRCDRIAPLAWGHARRRCFGDGKLHRVREAVDCWLDRPCIHAAAPRGTPLPPPSQANFPEPPSSAHMQDIPDIMTGCRQRRILAAIMTSSHGLHGTARVCHRRWLSRGQPALLGTHMLSHALGLK